MAVVRLSLMLALAGTAVAAPKPPQLERREADHAVPRIQMVMNMARLLRQHSHPETREMGEKAVALFAEHGSLDEVTMQRVTAMATGYLTPVAACQADLEWTAKQANRYSGANRTLTGVFRPFEELADENTTSPCCDSSKASGPYQGDMFAANDTQAARLSTMSDTSASFGAGTPWKHNTINYCFDEACPDAVFDAVAYSIKQFQLAVPCLQFADVGRKKKGRCNVSPAIYITSEDTGCWSYVGEISDWKAQGLNLQTPGCDSVGTTMHEFLHAMGLGHEQARQDRDDYINVNKKAIEDGKEAEFDQDNFGNPEKPYDMLSLMHYEQDAYTTDGADTITPKDKAYEQYTSDSNLYYKFVVGNRAGMTQLDANQLAKLYSCNASHVVNEGPCSDLTNSDDTTWTDSYNQDCNFYRSLSKGCSEYVAASFCCGCGGGIQLQTWMPSDAPSPPTSPPPPSPPPPSPPAPPPPSPIPKSTDTDIALSSTCNSWMDEGYCETDSYYYQYVTFYCVRTCSGHPTDKYLNCKSLAMSGYCPYYFSNGEKVIEGCPDSCEQFDRSRSTNKKQSISTGQDENDGVVHGGHPALQPTSGPFAGPIAPDPMLPEKANPPSNKPPPDAEAKVAEADSAKLAVTGPNTGPGVAHLTWRSAGKAKERHD